MKLSRAVLSLTVAVTLALPALAAVSVAAPVPPASALSLCSTCGLLGVLSGGSIVPFSDGTDYTTKFDGIDLAVTEVVTGTLQLTVYNDGYATLQISASSVTGGAYNAYYTGEATTTAASVSFSGSDFYGNSYTGDLAFEGSTPLVGVFQAGEAGTD